MLKMYGFWRSAAAFRVRMACNIKGIAYQETMINLDAGEQHAPEYVALNPQAVVPSLFLDDGTMLTQSVAILEYLEETHPSPALLPQSPVERARVRALALIWAADHHPLIVPRIRTYLRDVLDVGEEARTAWIQHWFSEGLRIGEARMTGDPATGKFCHGDTISIADLCLMSQVMGAKGFGVNIAGYPTINRILDNCLALDAVSRALPLKQPGAPVAH